MNLQTGTRESKDYSNTEMKRANTLYDFPTDGMDAILLARHASTYPAGAFLYFERETNRGVYVICSGKVKLSVSSSKGKTLILQIAKPGDILGLSSTLTHTPYEATAEVLQAARVGHLPAEEFRALMVNDPQAFLSVIRQLNRQYESCCEQLRTLALCVTTSQKLARLLLYWSEQGRQTPEGTHFILPLTQEQVGEFMGSTRESVTRTLSEFKRQRLIALHGVNVIIPNRRALEAVSGL